MTREVREMGKERERRAKEGGLKGRIWRDECGQCLLDRGLGVSTAM